jgi:hypothetical protein
MKKMKVSAKEAAAARDAGSSDKDLVEMVRDGELEVFDAIDEYRAVHQIPTDAVVKYAEERIGFSAYTRALGEIDAAFSGKDLWPVFDYLRRYKA